MKAIVKFSVGILASLVLALHVSAQPSSEKVDQPSPELRAAAVEMLDAVNLRQMMNQMSSAMAQATPQMLEQMSGKMFDKLPPEQQKVAKEKAASAAKAAADRAMAIYRDPEVIQGMEDIMVRAYVRRFTLAEIKSITAFYKIQERGWQENDGGDPADDAGDDA